MGDFAVYHGLIVLGVIAALLLPLAAAALVVRLFVRRGRGEPPRDAGPW